MPSEEPPRQRQVRPNALSAAGDLCAIRVVQEGADLVIVYEAERKDAPRRLVFESRRGTMFAEHFPTDWSMLPEGELLALRQPTSH